MNISPNTHLSYCTNIHPGEHWSDVWQSLKDYSLQTWHTNNKLAQFNAATDIEYLEDIENNCTSGERVFPTKSSFHTYLL